MRSIALVMFLAALTTTVIGCGGSGPTTVTAEMEAKQKETDDEVSSGEQDLQKETLPQPKKKDKSGKAKKKTEKTEKKSEVNEPAKKESK